MLVLMERCQDTQCIAVRCVRVLHSRRPVGVPMLTPVHTAESANNGHVSIRTGLEEGGLV